MDDGFHLGTPASRASRATSGPTLLLVGLGVAVLAALALVVLGVLRSGGEEIGRRNQQAVATVDLASDVEAQTNLRLATVAAMTLQASTGSIAGATPDALASVEPSIRFISGPSTGPYEVSVAASAQEWSAAVRSNSGTCFWTRVDAAGSHFYGSGTGCTGAAATGASAASW
jgi:hypothetical protein